MKTHTLTGIALTALILGGFAAGGATFAGTRDEAAVTKDANVSAAKAAKALRKGDAVSAVTLAEAAVAALPQDAAFRMLLAQSYLKAGRFTSAHQAFADVLTLTPGDGKAALYLALSQIAEGQWNAARQTLDSHQQTIPARDRGLAIALAGDPVGGVEVLMVAARAPDADAKTRQNLALTLALAGRWREAKTIVDVDVAPAEAQQRLMKWIAFAKPTSAADQVSQLLGIVPVTDAGQPVALALSVPVAVAPVEMAPVETATAAPTEAETVTETPVEVAAVVPKPATAPVVAAVPVAASGIVFAERHEVVQMLPPKAMSAARVIAAKGAFKTRIAAVTPISAPVAAKVPAKGNWYVQLGAFDSPGVARDAWVRAARRYTALGGHAPTGMAFKASKGSFYRLSVGGFARADAVTICRGIRAKGGSCFVRAGAGDQVASWIKPTRVQVASR